MQLSHSPFLFELLSHLVSVPVLHLTAQALSHCSYISGTEVAQT